MARPRNQDLVLEFESFHGGAQQVTDPSKIDPKHALLFLDMVLDEIGTVSARMGSTQLGTIGASGDRVLSAHVFQRAGQTTQFIVHLSDGTLRYSTNLSSWTTIASSLSTTAPFSYVTFVDNVFMANGTDDYRKWDGSAQTTYASVPDFKYLAAWKDGLWGAGEAANPHRVYASAAGDGTTWNALDFVDIAKGAGLGISGLGADANALIVFKYLETHALYDPVEFTNRIVDPEKGCISHFSIVEFDGVIYFASRRGICKYLGDAPSIIVSTPVQPLFDDTVYQISSEAKWWAYTYQNRVGWCWPRDTAEFVQMEYYPLNPDTPWTFHTMPARIVVSKKDLGTAEKLYGFGENSNAVGELYHSGSNNDFDSGSINPTLETGWFDFGNPVAKKHIQRILIYGRGVCGLEIKTDFSEDAIDPGFYFWGSTLDPFEESEIFTDVYGRQFKFRFNVGGTSTNNRVRATAEEFHISIVGLFSLGRMTVFAKLCGDGR